MATVAVRLSDEELTKRKAALMRRRLEAHTGTTGRWVKTARPAEKPAAAVLMEEEPADEPEQAAPTAGAAEEAASALAPREAHPAREKHSRRKQADAFSYSPPSGEGVSNEELQEKWLKDQLNLREQLVLKDEFDFAWPDSESKSKKPLQWLAGIDLSFVKGTDHAVCSLIVFEYPSLRIEYEGFTHCVARNPYLSGFLAYREIPGMLQAFVDFRKKRPDLAVQLLMVDGNGTLHHRGFGLACHFGVVTGIPCIGIGKSLLAVDGMDRDQVRRQTEEKSLGDVVDLWGNSGRVWGHALMTKPVCWPFISFFFV
ncbi:Endonuclease V [Diplonema papillatum]|nr:Endonuclease V [Diplonema papillatum]